MKTSNLIQWVGCILSKRAEGRRLFRAPLHVCQGGKQKGLALAVLFLGGSDLLAANSPRDGKDVGFAESTIAAAASNKAIAFPKSNVLDDRGAFRRKSGQGCLIPPIQEGVAAGLKICRNDPNGSAEIPTASPGLAPLGKAMSPKASHIGGGDASNPCDKPRPIWINPLYIASVWIAFILGYETADLWPCFRHRKGTSSPL